MKIFKIAEDNNKRKYYSASIIDINDFSIPFTKQQQYVCLFWPDQIYTSSNKYKYAEIILESGCRNVVCGGIESQEWECAFDEARKKLLLVDDKLVLTSSHPHQSNKQVANYFVNSNGYMEKKITKLLFLYIGNSQELMQQIENSIVKEISEI
jgi:hypothetical protein